MTQQAPSRRPRGTGSIYQRPDGMWIGRVTLPSEYGKRCRRKVSGMRFCDMLRKFSPVLQEHPPRPPAPTRGERLEAARLIGSHTSSEWNRKLWLSKGVCEYCGEVREFIEQDHKVPLCRGGSDSIDNLAVACRPCNQRKRRMTADEYMAMLHG